MNLDGLLQKAKSGDMAAQYELAEHYGKLLKETDSEEDIIRYSREAMIWLRKSARQGYGPAVDAVKELNQNRSDDLDAAAAETAAAVASAVENFDADYPAPAVRPPAQPLPAENGGSGAEPAQPAPREPEQKGMGRTALTCILIVSILVNIFVILFLIRIIRDRREPSPPSPSHPVSESAAPSPTKKPDGGQTGEDHGGQTGEAADPTPTPGASATPVPDPTATPVPTPGTTVTPDPTESPFWIDLDAHPELEMKPGIDSLYDSYVYFIVTADNLNVRSGPDTRYTKLTNLSAGDRVGAVGKYGNWYLVSVGSRLGWVSASYLTDDLSWKPAVTPDPSPTPTPPPAETPVPGGESSSGDLNVW